jgi:hypothetical protein
MTIARNRVSLVALAQVQTVEWGISGVSMPELRAAAPKKPLKPLKTRTPPGEGGVLGIDTEALSAGPADDDFFIHLHDPPGDG